MTMPFQTEADYRDFAKRYIIKRLDENRNDAIEELSAYLANWLHLQEIGKKFFDDIRIREMR